MKRIGSIVLAVSLSILLGSRAWASTETDLAAASAAGHPVFLIVTEGAAPGMDMARNVTSEAQKIVPGTTILEMDRGDSANAAVVKRLRLATAPVPLILVIASNGVPAGGAQPKAITAGRLAAMVPSPSKAAFLKALDERKGSILVFSRASMPARAGALQVAADAATTLKGAAAVVSVDLDAAEEAPFLAEMKVDPKAASPVVVVYNAKGQGTATFLEAPSAEALSAAVTKEVKSSCGPGGCGPNGCK